jgi:hypothetical protein
MITVTFPQIPIIIAMNLNRTENRRTLFESMIAFVANINENALFFNLFLAISVVNVI